MGNTLEKATATATSNKHTNNIIFALVMNTFHVFLFSLNIGLGLSTLSYPVNRISIQALLYGFCSSLASAQFSRRPRAHLHEKIKEK